MDYKKYISNKGLIRIAVKKTVAVIYGVMYTTHCEYTRLVSCLLNRFEFHFLRLHMHKTNIFCFFMHNGRIPGIAKKIGW